MQAGVKLMQRKLYTFLSTSWGIAMCLVLSVWLLNSIVRGGLHVVEHIASQCRGPCAHDYADNIAGRSFETTLCMPPIDIVYTWVNGSDPRFLEQVAKYKALERVASGARHGHTNSSATRQGPPTASQAQPPIAPGAALRNGTASAAHAGAARPQALSNATKERDAGKNRYRDFEELRYSLRSIWRYAPWVRRIFVVTNGQIPHWLNVDHPRLTLVTHAEIFANKSHLPVFSSPSIEANLHRIPGLSEKFIYFNDDVMLGNTLYPEDFFTHSRGQRVFLSWEVPQCAQGCPDAWIGDGYCDNQCNVEACNFDNGDCVNGTASNRRFGGWQAGRNQQWGRGSADTVKYCMFGCPNNWIGDKVCDRACKHKECAYDGGDCGAEPIVRDLRGFVLTPSLRNITLPAGTHAFYVNLTRSLIGKVTRAEHDNADFVRTAIVTQKLQLLTVLLFTSFEKDHVFQPEVNFFLEGDRNVSFNFTVHMPVAPLPKVTNATGSAASRLNASLSHEHSASRTTSQLPHAAAPARASSGGPQQISPALGTSAIAAPPAGPHRASSTAMHDLSSRASAAEAAAEARIVSSPPPLAPSALVQRQSEAAAAGANGDSAARADPAPRKESEEKERERKEMQRREMAKLRKESAAAELDESRRDPKSAGAQAKASERDKSAAVDQQQHSRHATQAARPLQSAPIHKEAKGSKPPMPPVRSDLPREAKRKEGTKHANRDQLLRQEAQEKREDLEKEMAEYELERHELEQQRKEAEADRDALQRELAQLEAEREAFEEAAGEGTATKMKKKKKKKKKKAAATEGKKKMMTAEGERKEKESEIREEREKQEEREETEEEEREKDAEEEEEKRKQREKEKAIRKPPQEKSKSKRKAAQSERRKDEEDELDLELRSIPQRHDQPAKKLHTNAHSAGKASFGSETEPAPALSKRRQSANPGAGAGGGEPDAISESDSDGEPAPAPAPAPPRPKPTRQLMTIAQGQPAFDVGGAWASRPGEADASVEASEGVEVTVEGVPDSESLAEALVRPVRTADDAELARLIAIAKRKELEEMHEHDYRLLFERERERLRREREETGGSQVVWPWEVDVRGAAAEFSADELGGRELGARSAGSRRLLDMYGDSLRYVSMLYNKHFGRETRKAPAHMPHFLDRNILHEMIDETFPDRFAATSSHRFRDSHDMQYAFSYFYFLMNQPRPFVLEREFAEHYDLDGDGVLAAFEVRNLYLFLHNKKGPGDKKVEAEFYGMLSNCTVDYLRKHGVSRVENLTVSALPYDLVASCKPLVAALKKKISSQKKYRFELTGLEQVEFYMVPDDFNKAQKRLDDIRVKMPKFICLNDDMNKTHDPDPRTVRVLREFYHSYFPLPSPFELEPDDYHTILHVDDLRAHRRFVSLGKVLALLAAAAAAVSLLRTTWVWGWARMWLLARCRGVLHWLEPTHE